MRVGVLTFQGRARGSQERGRVCVPYSACVAHSRAK